MAKLSELVKTIDETAKAGDRQKALNMVESLMKKVPPDKLQPLEKRRDKYAAELELDRRIQALEKQYRV